MMMNIKKIVLLLVLITVVVGCKKGLDYLDDPADTNVISFSIVASSQSDIGVSTRSGLNEYTIHRGYLFFFDSDDNSLQGYEKISTELIDGNGSSTLSFEVENASYESGHRIICVFNYDDELEIGTNYFDGLTYTTVSSYFPMDADFLTRVEADMNSSDDRDDDQTQYSLGMPMFVNDFTDSNISTREVYRALARIEVSIASDLVLEDSGHSHLFSVDELKFAVVNSSATGNIGFSTLDYTEATAAETIVAPTTPSTDDNGTTTGLAFPYSLTEYDSSVATYDLSTDSKIYLYAFPHSNTLLDGESIDADLFHADRFSIMLQHSQNGSQCYYKLNLTDKSEVGYYDVERNHDYRVVITAVDSHGYTTVEEAYNMPPSNIEYMVYDFEGGATLSNGQYAISMDEILNYQEIIMYGPATMELSFDNICYILPDEMTENEYWEYLEDMTNEVIFDYSVTVLTGQAWDYEPLSVTVVQNDFETNSKLTADRRSIVLSLEGEGEMTITLTLKLGNLEIGGESISIKKVGEDGLGSFDAHPGQLRLDDQVYVEGTWTSTDQDFGIWYDSANEQNVIYMGENATPVGYATMDGYISASSALDSYPVFSDKTREGNYTYEYEDEDGETQTVKTMVILHQLAPFYTGHFGSNSTNASSPHYYNALIVEKIEEIKDNSWQQKETGGVMSWSTSDEVYYDKDVIYGEIYGYTRYLNFVEGLTITNYMVENTTASGTASAAKYCYMKNDINGDGVIDPSSEPIVWYLPAQNQMLSMWISKHLFEEDPDYAFDLEESPSAYYWTCSETSGTGQPEDKDFTTVTAANMLEGEMISARSKTGTSDTDQGHVRCVRGIYYTTN